MPRKAKIPDCHPDRPHQGLGLCRQCYNSKYNAENLEERRDDAKAWYENNKERATANRRAWKIANPEKVKQSAAAHRVRNREILKIKGREYREAHKDEAKLYYAANRDKSIAKSKEWYKNNTDRHASYRLFRNFGITLDTYNAILKFQNGVCAICNNVEPSGKRLAVDHDHATKAIRGLLCQMCNKGIGHFDPATIGGKIGEYLSNPPYLRYIEFSVVQTPAE